VDAYIGLVLDGRLIHLPSDSRPDFGIQTSHMARMGQRHEPGGLHQTRRNAGYKAACEGWKNVYLGARSSYAVASVYTPSRYRERGYAKHLMRLLHFVIADPSLLPPFPIEDWGVPPVIPPNANLPYRKAVASGLYSDVGSNFYRFCGPGMGPNATDKRGWNTIQ
jgi:hypothetical protein